MPLFIPITKVDIAQRLVYGTISEEVPDKTGEILDYKTAKPAFEEWSQQFHAASNGKSLGNVRAMHGAVAAGKLTDIAYDDEQKRIEGVAKIVDEDEWHKVVEGVYTGFSIGGGYARRWPDPDNPALMRYTPTLSEVSLVDNPALSTATFQVIKRDGSVECRKFYIPQEVTMKREEKKPKAVKDNSGNMPAEMTQPEIMDLLDDLAWLEECAREDGNSEILACVATLQEYLCEEYGIDESGREGMESLDEGASAHAYAAELAQPDADDTGMEATARKFVPPQQEIQLVQQLAWMSAEMKNLQQRLGRLEAQPLPAKGVLRAISKSDDRMAAQEALKTLSPSERAHELMKLAMANPIEM